MNNDLISRSEAKKLGATCLAKRNENGQLEAIISLDNAPTVELFCSYLSDGEVREPCVEGPCKHERPQGEWVIDNWGMYHCNYCMKEKQQLFNNFCSFCGADMRGKKNETDN